MIRAATITVALLAGGFAAISLAPQAVSQTGPGWVQLFDGKTMDGWTVDRRSQLADRGRRDSLPTRARAATW